MSNAFSKEERVQFENVLEGFNDALVLSQNVAVFNTDQTMMARTNDVIWRPQPYIAQSYDGTDATANFNGATQLSVPVTIGTAKHSTAMLTSLELRDATQEQRLGDAAKQKLSSDINLAIMNVASNQGSLVVKRTVAATGFDDVALAKAIMDEQGVNMFDRCIAFSPRDANGVSSNLAGRQTMQGKPTTAYEACYIGRIAGFDTLSLDYANRLNAATGGGSLTIDTRDSAANYYIPVATSTGVAGETSNVDNRFQTITISSTTGVAAGDAFTVAALNSVHHITKQDTGQLKTFRVIQVASSTTLVITPPIITNQVASNSSAQYQNCVINTKASNSAIVFLNTVTTSVNPFWQKDALEIIPGQYVVPADAGVGVLTGATDQGFQLVMTKFFDINTYKYKVRWDTFFGVANKQPEMTGIMLFNQS